MNTLHAREARRTFRALSQRAALTLVAVLLSACAAPVGPVLSGSSTLGRVQAEPTATTSASVKSSAQTVIATITVDPGSMLERDIIPQLRASFGLSTAEVKAALAGADSELLMSPGLTGFRRMEGMVPPGQYEIRKGTTLNELVAEWVRVSENRYRSLEASSASGNGLTAPQRLALASMVEAECLAGTHRQETATVFLNRLARGSKLQSCVTAEYALGYQRPFLTLRDVSVASDYNTYHTKGLPVGPICSVSDESLQAAITGKPDGRAFYFYYDYLANDMHFFSDYKTFRSAATKAKLRFEAESPVGVHDRIDKQTLYR